uniref:Glyco_hydro_76 n=1 Tax=uncultured Metarhizium TaxID=556047 RepID=A0A060C3P1_9HYPO|nr:Glyco_hydro_76 [uncultured Metarhizium]
MDDNFVISKESLLTRAINQLSWYKSSGIINSDNQINDGLDDNCKNNQEYEWTYNQGALLPGLALLKITKKDDYATFGVDLINAFIKKFNYGVISEVCDDVNMCDKDQNLFKGIFMQHLIVFY